MTEPTDEKFAAAYRAMIDTPVPKTQAERGRAMLAALQAHGCIPQQQGLTVRQELAARILCAALSGGWVQEEMPERLADMILALEDRQ